MASSQPSRKCVLVVEDDPEYQELLQKVLSKACAVVVCASAEEAREKITATRFNLVLADINLLGMNGFEVIRAIKQAGLADACPVVMFSSLTDPATKQQAEAAGAAGFISKPFDMDKLLPALYPLLGIKPTP